MRFRFLPLLLVLAELSLPGCDKEGPAPREEIVVGIGSWPTNLDPRFAPDAWSEKLSGLVFSPLLQRDSAGILQPHLATAVRFADPLTLVVSLRADVRFHDGSPLEARDVVATYSSILDPALGSVKRLGLEPIETVEARGSYEVVFHLGRAHAPLLQTLAAVGIASAKEIAAGDTNVSGLRTGSGPFLFERIEQDVEILLTRNEDWFGGRAASPSLRFKIVPDATVRSLELLRGSIDLVQNDLPPHVVGYLAEQRGLRVQTAESTLVKYLAFNLTRPPLDDPGVRRALALAIDREGIARHKLRGFATPAESFLHPASWAHRPLAPLPYAPLEAEALLDAAGLHRGEDGWRLHLVYRTSQDETAVAVARILRRNLAQVGVEMELRSNEWGVFFSDIRQGDFDLYTLSGVGIVDPDWYSFVMHSARQPPHGANRERYVSAEMDRLLDLGRTTLDPLLRAPIYRQVQELAAKDLPLLPLWYEHNVAVFQDDVVGYAIRPDGGIGALVHTRHAP